MPVILIGLVILLLTITSANHVASIRAEHDAADRAAAAMSFRNYAQHVEAYVLEHPNENGAIRLDELAIPTWHTPRSMFRNHVLNGISFTYISRADMPNLEALLIELARTCSRCGWKRDSSVIALDGTVIGGAPSVIAEGSLVRRFDRMDAPLKK